MAKALAGTETSVDELFLTLSPQIAGHKADTIRPGLVQGMEFMPNCSPWFQLLSLKQRAEHLYLRIQLRRDRST